MICANRESPLLFLSNFGKLNYWLGARAAKEGRASAYPDIDFCKVSTFVSGFDMHSTLDS